jgi:hypothetical protein
MNDKSISHQLIDHFEASENSHSSLSKTFNYSHPAKQSTHVDTQAQQPNIKISFTHTLQAESKLPHVQP